MRLDNTISGGLKRVQYKLKFGNFDLKDIIYNIYIKYIHTCNYKVIVRHSKSILYYAIRLNDAMTPQRIY